MHDQKSPPSEMIRVPVPLIGVVRRLSKLHRQGHTIALLQALEELIGEFDSKNDIDITTGSKQVLQLQQKLEELESHLADRDKLLETKLETMNKQLELIERAIASGRSTNTRPRRQVYSHQQPQVELQPRTNTSLAQRLGVTSQSLITEREKLSTKEFFSYTRHRDPMSTGWKWNANTGLYDPVK
ncbi:hypothetical protein [Nostoc sp. CCY0012]|uniref:hypothetical protein n=1 Tax=Nostoc sp. CCY0012 TaxID=1056123 RepID=UPI0039C5EE3C